MTKIFGYLIAILILIGVAWVLYDRGPHISFVSNTARTTPIASAVQTAHIQEDTATYTINMNYAVTGITAVDAAVKYDIDAAVAEFKGYPSNPADSAVPKNELNSDVGPVYIGQDVVSVELLISEYTGGAHPNTIINAVNIDRKSGREVALSDALALIGKSLPDVSRESLAQLKQKLGDIVFEDGAQPNSDNFQTFLIDAANVTFVFQNYQVAPYAAGPQFISFTRVK